MTLPNMDIKVLPAWAAVFLYALLGAVANAGTPGPLDVHPQNSRDSSDSSGKLAFRLHTVSTDFPVYTNPQGWPVGDYGASGLADFDRDGDLDFTMARPASFGPSRVYWFEYQGPDHWITHIAGRDAVTSVGAEVMDVDGDGWTDILHGGAWYRNTGKPRTEEFELRVFDPAGGSVHDIIVVDVDGDGAKDIVTLSDRAGLFWYRMPGFQKHRIADGVHGGVAPKGAGDLDGDGDVDLVRANVWLENLDAKGGRWAQHALAFGKDGGYGVAARSWVTDLDCDGDNDMVLADCDRYRDAEICWLENADGKGRTWTTHPLGTGIDFHSLAVADFDQDGDEDVFACDAEVSEGPWKWVIWENADGCARQFVPHIIVDVRLGGHETRIGDVDGDGDIDLVSKPWVPSRQNAVGGKIHVDFLENLLHQQVR